jgi:hypothetical protein
VLWIYQRNRLRCVRTVVQKIETPEKAWVKAPVGKGHLVTWVLFGNIKRERDLGCPGEKIRNIGRRSCGASDVAVRLGGQALLTGYRIYTAVVWPETVNRLAILGRQCLG